MATVAELNEQEKIFLAGAMKAIILADGPMDEQALDDLDRIVTELNFSDFDEHLERFESAVKGESDFEFLARNIYHPQTKSLMTQILWELSLQKGFASADNEEMIEKIRQWWKED